MPEAFTLENMCWGRWVYLTSTESFSGVCLAARVFQNKGSKVRVICPNGEILDSKWYDGPLTKQEQEMIRPFTRQIGP